MSDISNRFSFADREKITGHIGGVDFGYNMSCIARSADVALLWSGGGGYWSGIGMPYAYAASHLILLTRTGREHHMMPYRRVGAEGGRLTVAKVTECKADIMKAFGDDQDVFLRILQAVKDRKTLLIEGGGEAFRSR